MVDSDALAVLVAEKELGDLDMGGGGGSSFTFLFFEMKCDLCTLPQDYSRTGRYIRIAAPALIVGYLAILTLRMLLSGVCCGGEARARHVLPVTTKPSSDICPMSMTK